MQLHLKQQFNLLSLILITLIVSKANYILIAIKNDVSITCMRATFTSAIITNNARPETEKTRWVFFFCQQLIFIST